MHSYNFNGNILTYESFGNKSDKVVILLPPGVGKSSHFSRMARAISQWGFYVLSFNFPGSGGSVFDGRLCVEEISIAIQEEILRLKPAYLCLIGESYGGNVAVVTSFHLSVDKMILLGSGEYFNLPIKVLLDILFRPAKLSHFLRPLYAKFLTSNHIVDFSGCNQKQLDNCYSRWDEILWYKLPKGKSLAKEVYFLKGEKDKILNQASITKLKRLLPHIQVDKISGGHFDYDEELAKTNYNKIRNLLFN